MEATYYRSGRKSLRVDRPGSRCTFEELPANAQAYVLRLEELSGARISCIGVGPGRDQTIVRHDVLG
jgi:adenylosuccinate synthase